MTHNTTNEERIFVSTKEAAAMLNVSMPTMYQFINSEGFPAMRAGRKVLVNVEGLRRWAAEKCGVHN